MDGADGLILRSGAWCVAALAAYFALGLAARTAIFDGRYQRPWLSVAALSMGAGIWAVQFVGMKELSLPLSLRYDLLLNLLCWTGAVLVSLLALYFGNAVRNGPLGTAGGGVILGVGICLVHYGCMYALHLAPRLGYDSELFSASVFIAVAASIAGLAIGFPSWPLAPAQEMTAKVLAALLLAIAICGTHYTAVAATHFPAQLARTFNSLLAGNTVGLMLVAFTTGMVVAVLLLSMIDAGRLALWRRVERQRLVLRLRRGLADLAG